MDTQQLSLFDQPLQPANTSQTVYTRYESQTNTIRILISALSAKVFTDNRSEIIGTLSHYPEAKAIAKLLGDSQLTRQFNIQQTPSSEKQLEELIIQGERVIYQNQDIGRIQLLYKPPLPGELQAKLAYESIIDRFLEYLQKKNKIAILHESDYHVQIFIPKTKESEDLTECWNQFIKEVAFAKDGDFQQTLSNLRQTFILMLKSVTLAGRGFSTLEIPIINQDQAIVLASLYFAVWEQVKKRQKDRQSQINKLVKDLEDIDLTEKERTSKEKELKKKQEMQDKEAKKYQDYFEKTVSKLLEKQQDFWNELQSIESQLNQTEVKKAQINKLNKQKNKLQNQIIFTLESLANKQRLLAESQGDPFEFISLDIEQNPEKFQDVLKLNKSFDKKATEQINSTRGDIFSQCIVEMYRLLELTEFDNPPEPLLTTYPKLLEMRIAGDDGKDFCYSCGVALDKKNAQWRVARFMFERPSQRRQSSSSEDRPFICAGCSVLSFASPLKVTDDSIILKLEPKFSFNTSYSGNDSKIRQSKLKDYIRGWVTGEIDLISGKYIIFNSNDPENRTAKGDVASQKLGLKQYALAKIASKFPLETLSDWTFNLYLQSSQPDTLENRQLIFIKGLMEGYSQSILTKGNKGQEINLKLGDAIRYVQQDLPYLADYTILKTINYNLKFQDRILMETIRELYYQTLYQDLQNQQMSKGGLSMSETQLAKRAKIYGDVAALTGLLYPFIEYAEYLIKKDKQAEEKRKQGKKEQDNLDPATMEKIKKDVAREVSKIIENVKDEHFFTYYASIGDQNRTKIKATLKRNRDTYFIYDQAKKLLLEILKISDLQEGENNGKPCLELTLDDLKNAFHYFASDPLYSDSKGDKGWNDLTYRLKLSLYTRFPELVRKLSSKGDN